MSLLLADQGSALPVLTCSLSAIEAQDTVALTVAVRVTGTSFDVTEAKDIVAVTANAIVNIAVSATETKDAATITAHAIISANLATTEAQDIAAIDAHVIVDLNAVLNVTEAQDIVDIQTQAEQEEARHAFSEYPAHPLSFLSERFAQLRVSEARDMAAIQAAFDYTDDELVMSMMMAAWDEEEALA